MVMTALSWNLKAWWALTLPEQQSDVKKLMNIGVAPADATLDQTQVAALTMVAAAVMNSPDAYTLR